MKTGLIFRILRQVTSYFTLGAETERMFRREMTALLPPGFQLFRSSRYTEDETEFKGELRLRAHATDYLVTHGGMVIAAVEVTTGSKGYSYQNSKHIPIDEDKLAPMDQFNEGFVVERVLVGEPHFIWASREDIRRFKEEMGTHRTDIKIWKPNLKTLVDVLVKLAEREEKLSVAN